MADEAKLYSPIGSTFQCWLCNMKSDVVMGKNWALSVDQCQLQALQFWVHPINSLSILLRGNGFARIQKPVVDQTPPNSDHDLFWCKFGFGKCFGASSWSNHWVGHRWLSYKIYFLFHDTIWSRNGLWLLSRIRDDDTSKWRVFWFVVSSWGTHLSSLFTFPVCFKCWTTTEWLMLSSSATSHVVIRGSAAMMALKLVITSFWWPATLLPILKALFSFAELLELLLHCMFVSSSWAKCVADVASCLRCFTTHFELG